MKMTNRTRKPSSATLFGIAALLCVSFIAACGSGSDSGGKRYALTGRVMRVDRSTNTVIVDGDAIPGYMDAMEMPYQVTDPKLLDPLTVGDQIKADVVVASDGTHLENIVVTKKADATKTPSTPGRSTNRSPARPCPIFCSSMKMASRFICVIFAARRCF